MLCHPHHPVYLRVLFMYIGLWVGGCVWGVGVEGGEEDGQGM